MIVLYEVGDGQLFIYFWLSNSEINVFYSYCAQSNPTSHKLMLNKGSRRCMKNKVHNNHEYPFGYGYGNYLPLGQRTSAWSRNRKHQFNRIKVDFKWIGSKPTKNLPAGEADGITRAPNLDTPTLISAWSESNVCSIPQPKRGRITSHVF